MISAKKVLKVCSLLLSTFFIHAMEVGSTVDLIFHLTIKNETNQHFIVEKTWEDSTQKLKPGATVEIRETGIREATKSAMLRLKLTDTQYGSTYTIGLLNYPSKYMVEFSSPTTTLRAESPLVSAKPQSSPLILPRVQIILKGADLAESIIKIESGMETDI